MLFGSTPITHILFRTGMDAKIRQLVLDMFQEAEDPDRMINRYLNVCYEWLCIYLIRNLACEAPLTAKPDKGRDMMQMFSYIRANHQEISLRKMAESFG